MFSHTTWNKTVEVRNVGVALSKKSGAPAQSGYCVLLLFSTFSIWLFSTQDDVAQAPKFMLKPHCVAFYRISSHRLESYHVAWQWICFYIREYLLLEYSPRRKPTLPPLPPTAHIPKYTPNKTKTKQFYVCNNGMNTFVERGCRKSWHAMPVVFSFKDVFLLFLSYNRLYSTGWSTCTFSSAIFCFILLVLSRSKFLICTVPRVF